MDKLLTLSHEQQMVLGYEKHSLAISGVPGGGKTTLIREMIQQNIRQGYSPEDILFVSFGRKDADVFSDKLDEVNMGSVLSATCHGFCYRICVEDARKKKLKKWLSKQGTLNLVQGRARLELVDEAATEAKVAYQMDYARDIDYLKSIGCRPEDKKTKYLLTPAIEWTAINIERNPYQRSELIGELKSCRTAVYRKYQELLDSRGLVDFGELQLWAERAMQRDPELLDQFAYKVVYIDESHDLSEQQWRIVSFLLQKAELSRVSFDVSQSIYSFRGAIGQGILKRVRSILPDIELLKLVENHRSAPQIVQHAETIIPRGMKATRDIQGTVQVYPDKFTDPEKHADEIVGIVSRWKDQGTNFGDIAILYRYRAPMVHAQVALTKAKIPNQIGITPFTKLPEVKDLLAWVLMSDVARSCEVRSKAITMEKHPGPWHPFWRIYKAPAIALTDSQGYVIRNQKGIAQTLGSSWQRLATKHRGSLRELLQPDLYPLRYQQALILLRRNIEYIQTCNWTWDVLNYVVNIMTPRYWEYQLLMAGERLGDPHQHIKALMDVAKNFQDKGEFMNFMNGLDHVLKQDVVELTTIHQSKGKQYPCVIGVLSDEMMSDRREEQRIRYVCTTRPEQHLVETIV